MKILKATHYKALTPDRVKLESEFLRVSRYVCQHKTKAATFENRLKDIKKLLGWGR